MHRLRRVIPKSCLRTLSLRPSWNTTSKPRIRLYKSSIVYRIRQNRNNHLRFLQLAIMAMAYSSSSCSIWRFIRTRPWYRSANSSRSSLTQFRRSVPSIIQICVCSKGLSMKRPWMVRTSTLRMLRGVKCWTSRLLSRLHSSQNQQTRPKWANTSGVTMRSYGGLIAPLRWLGHTWESASDGYTSTHSLSLSTTRLVRYSNGSTSLQPRHRQLSKTSRTRMSASISLDKVHAPSPHYQRVTKGLTTQTQSCSRWVLSSSYAVGFNNNK